MIPMTVTFTNESNYPALYRLHVHPFRDLDNGKKDSDLGGKLLWAGKLENIIQLKPKEQYKMNVIVSFLVEGVYNFLAGCENMETLTTCCSQKLIVEVQQQTK